MSDYPAEVLFLFAEFAWLFSMIGAVVAGLDLVLGFVIWFGGFLVVAECLPPDWLRARTRKLLSGVVVVGYIGFVVAVFWIVQSWL